MIHLEDLPPKKQIGVAKRMGVFRIDAPVIADHPETAIVVLAGCIVVRAETFWKGPYVEYLAMHADFDETRDGEPVPRYDAIINEWPDGSLTRQWVRRP